ncbi:hypothetical protein Y023_4725 [Burkholderia pseudomallei A79D]|nr:hypothetical protein Y023_4725 [Burkholderia pseudomallei A79D]
MSVASPLKNRMPGASTAQAGRPVLPYVGSNDLISLKECLRSVAKLRRRMRTPLLPAGVPAMHAALPDGTSSRVSPQRVECATGGSQRATAPDRARACHVRRRSLGDVPVQRRNARLKLARSV